jgi:hypothetical protein
MKILAAKVCQSRICQAAKRSKCLMNFIDGGWGVLDVQPSWQKMQDESNQWSMRFARTKFGVNPWPEFKIFFHWQAAKRFEGESLSRLSPKA